MYKIFSLLFFCLLWGAGVAAPTDRYEELTGEEDDFKVIEKSWEESTARIPPLPAEKNWQEIRIDALPKGQHLYLDLSSLYIDKKDWVVRYWLLVRSDAGAFNATFEGMRCVTKEFVIYAYGVKDREPSVRQIKQPKWKKVGHRRQFNFRDELRADVFCAGETPRTKPEIEASAKGAYEYLNPFNNWVNDD